MLSPVRSTGQEHAMTLTELLLLVIVIGGAAYAGYIFGRWSAFSEMHRDGPMALPRTQDSPLPGPHDLDEIPQHGAPPPASAGGRYADASASGAPRPRAAPPPASAGGAPAGEPRSGAPAPRRSVPPPPARAGLLDPGASTKPGKKS
jgi:hypothetical protein